MNNNFNINSHKQTKKQPLSGSFSHIHILWVSELLQAIVCTVTGYRFPGSRVALSDLVPMAL